MAPHRSSKLRRRTLATFALAAVFATACSARDSDPVPSAVTTGAAGLTERCPPAAPVVGADAEFTSVLATGEGCPRTEAMLVRCAPRLDPVLTLGASPRRDFLGGRFAVAVRAVPDGVPLLGDASGGQIYLEPGDHGRLFVVQDGETKRWLELPAHGPAAPSQAFVLGDSIALGSAEDITTSLPAWSTTIDAVVGRPTTAGVPIASSIDLRSSSAVVVELGTNDHDASAFARSAREILGSLDHEALVVWVAPHAPSETTDEVRREIGRLVGRTANAVVADWSAAVPPGALSSDGVHLLPERTDLFADFLAPYLRDWRLAAEGMGATGCITGR